MNRKAKNIDQILDQGLDAIRSEPVDTTAAAARAWARISAERDAAPAPARDVEHIEGCADFQSLMPAYLLGGLTESRTLLLEDHVRECVPCRRALRDARGNRPSHHRPVTAARRFQLSTPARRAVAAALVLGSIAVPLAYLTDFVPSTHANVVLEEANGAVLRLSDADAARLSAGDRIEIGQRIRTAREAGAVVRIGDLALVEMRERSQFRVTESRSGATLWLDRGSVIVRPGSSDASFAVATPDNCITIGRDATYAVSSGVKGSRISAVSGVVTVDVAGEERQLQGGEQVSTTPSLAGVPVRDDVAWSRNSEDLEALLSQISGLRADLNARVSMPDARYSSRLLGLMSEGTVFYAAIPNLGDTLAQAESVIDEHVRANQTLREWMASEGASRQQAMREGLARMREVSAFLGTEIVVGAQVGRGDREGSPIILAEVADAAGLRAYIERNAVEGLGLIDDLAAARPATDGLNVWLSGDTLVASPSIEAVRAAAAAMVSPDANPFLTTPFYSRLAGLYREGAGIILAVDLQRIIADETASEGKTAATARLGIDGIQNLIFTQKGSGEALQSQAVLTFGGERRGITTWMAAPGPMGGLEYVSPGATAAAAFVIDKPVALVDDLFGFLREVDAESWGHFEALQSQHGIDVRTSFAAPLGGELVFAIDGPVLPTPSWKLIVEVYDPATLQAAIEHAVVEVNRTTGQESLTHTSEDASGVTYHVIRSPESGAEIVYAYAQGYLVAGPSRAVVERALQIESSGVTLPRSAKFRGALPAGSDANFSALLYHDLGSLVGSYAGQIARASGADKKTVMALTGGPTLVTARALGDHIAFAGRSGGSAIGLTPDVLFAGPRMFGIGEILSGMGH